MLEQLDEYLATGKVKLVAVSQLLMRGEEIMYKRATLLSQQNMNTIQT